MTLAFLLCPQRWKSEQNFPCHILFLYSQQNIVLLCAGCVYCIGALSSRLMQNSPEEGAHTTLWVSQPSNLKSLSSQNISPLQRVCVNMTISSLCLYLQNDLAFLLGPQRWNIEQNFPCHIHFPYSQQNRVVLLLGVGCVLEHSAFVRCKIVPREGTHYTTSFTTPSSQISFFTKNLSSPVSVCTLL